MTFFALVHFETIDGTLGTVPYQRYGIGGTWYFFNLLFINIDI
jgi:hypothetical protein